MIASLLAGTHGIRRRARGAGGRASGSRPLFARDTASALGSGSNHAAAALIDRAVHEASGRVWRAAAAVADRRGRGNSCGAI